MTDFRSRKGGSHYPLSPKRAEVDGKWIQGAVNPKHKGYAREYVERLYGREALTERGTLKIDYLDKAIEHAHQTGDYSAERRLILAKRLKEMSRERKENGQIDPYGTTKPRAEEEVHRLREDGEHARLIETNRKKELYAPYEGALKAQAPPVRPSPGRISYSEAHKNMKEVPVKLRITGDTRKGSVYAAVITGTDPKYGLKREFIKGNKTYSGKHDLTVDYEAKLKPGTIIETGESGSWNNKYGNYYIVTPGGLRQLKGNYNGEGMLYVKDLMKAREKALSPSPSHQ